MAQPSQRRSHVLPDAVDDANGPDVTRFVDGERDVAKRAAARVCGIRGGQPATLERVLPKRAVRLDLFPQFGVVSGSEEEVQQAADEGTHYVASSTC